MTLSMLSKVQNMTKIKMLIDFRGRETNEQYYKAGEVVEVSDGIAARLIETKRAELAEIETPPAQPAKKGKKNK